MERAMNPPVLSFAVFLKERDLLTEGVGQQPGYDGGSVDVVVGVVLLTLGLGGFLAR